MRNNTTVILVILLILAITFAVFQTARLNKAIRGDSALKSQFINAEQAQDKIILDLQKAYKNIDMLKSENARLSALLAQKQAEVKQAESKSIDTDKRKAEELKKKTERTLGIMP